MSTRSRVAFGSLAAMIAIGAVVFASDLKSGPQPGKSMPTFDPLNIFNAEAPGRNGKESCFI